VAVAVAVVAVVVMLAMNAAAGPPPHARRRCRRDARTPALCAAWLPAMGERGRHVGGGGAACGAQCGAGAAWREQRVTRGAPAGSGWRGAR
jgi:hypothetical protein